MQVDILELYQSIFQHQGIGFFTFQKNFYNISALDYGFRASIFKNYTYDDFISILLGLEPENPVLFFHDRLSLDYCTFLLPKAWQDEYQISYIVIGPILSHTLDISELKSLIRKNGLPQKHMQNWLEFYNRIPTIPSIGMWRSLLRPLFLQIYSHDVPYLSLDFTSVITNEEDFSTVSGNAVSLSVLENRYYVENQILDAVANGNQELATDWYQKFTNFKFVPRSANPIRHQKNLLLVFNTLLRKTMERVQIHPYYIDKLSTELAIKIERCSSLKQLESMDAVLIRKYCLLVKNHSGHHYPELIEKCIQYIDINYKNNITVTELAKYCSVTGNYLSALFRRETGKTIVQYINETRIEHSILLLNTTKSTIQQIANQCGFPDANYYSRTFKKIKGFTPIAYRKKIL